MKFYSVEEVAELFGISRMSVYRYIDEGKLRAVKLRGEKMGRVKVSYDALVEYIRENTTTEMIFKMKRKSEEIKRLLGECEKKQCNCAVKDRLRIIYDALR
ncbi:helix-turn-helix domain-containing protein [Deferribacter autotrophicus]|uniref:Helix-turn-helix domain-containing protein n=1 Tax=Deferribacter autotrophicus TaxID=500465 RepID=A0A5A8EZU0_9BACT|nr:helix-turn-helix domain-containing protein [Deferribacter autotrophicus]KAA0257200.1 helix-turn-helix domain-containing protein [Deferribacter autotrophicus]